MKSMLDKKYVYVESFKLENKVYKDIIMNL